MFGIGLYSWGARALTILLNVRTPRFFQSIYAFVNLELDKTVGGNVDVVFVPDFFRYFGGMELRVLVMGHVVAKIEVGDVDAKVIITKMGVGDGYVDVEFFVWHRDGRLANVVWAVKTISSGGHLDPVSF